jgi:hypothetical protein
MESETRADTLPPSAMSARQVRLACKSPLSWLVSRCVLMGMIALRLPGAHGRNLPTFQLFARPLRPKIAKSVMSRLRFDYRTVLPESFVSLLEGEGIVERGGGVAKTRWYFRTKLQRIPGDGMLES